MPNYEAGAKTPLACVFAAILLVALVSVSAAVLEQIPLAAIGAMLLLVAWSLFDVARLRQISRLSRIEFGIAIATLLATLLLRLEVAVLLGTALSLGAYLYQTSRPAVRDLLPDAESGRDISGRPMSCPIPRCNVPSFALYASRVRCSLAPCPM
jgi:SulP family sulfate permease